MRISKRTFLILSLLAAFVLPLTFARIEAKPAATKKKPLTRDELNQRLMAAGLITSLPDPALDIDDDDPDDQPVTIKGEPLSETIIRERR